jgi:hypothetical protein
LWGGIMIPEGFLPTAPLSDKQYMPQRPEELTGQS